MGGMEAVLSEQCGLQWAGAIGVQGGERARSQNLTTRNAGDRDMVIHDGKDASFCRSCRFVCSFIAHLPPFLPTSIILVRFFFYLITCFLTLFCLFFAYFLILLLLQCNDPTPQTHARFCGYHRRTEIHVHASCACFVGLDHDPFSGCVGSALNSVSILPHLLDANSKSRSTIHVH